jgi:hypothetical protein
MLAIIRSFLEFVMKGRVQTTLIAMLCAFIPLLGWVSSVIIALLTLRKGILAGLVILLWTALPSVVLTWYGDPKSLYINVVCGTLLTWILAAVLRITVEWRIVLLVAIILGIGAVGVAHLVVPDMQAWWIDKLQIAINQASKAGILDISATVALTAFKPVIPYITGMLAVSLLLIALANVLIARWAQAMLYNPGGLKEELYRLRLDKFTVIGLLVFTAILFFDNPLALDCLPIILLMLALIGLTVIHVLLAKTQHSTLWLTIFYGLLILLLQPVVMMLAVVAVLDSLIDIRKRVRGVE